MAQVMFTPLFVLQSHSPLRFSSVDGYTPLRLPASPLPPPALRDFGSDEDIDDDLRLPETPPLTPIAKAVAGPVLAEMSPFVVAAAAEPESCPIALAEPELVAPAESRLIAVAESCSLELVGVAAASESQSIGSIAPVASPAVALAHTFYSLAISDSSAFSPLPHKRKFVEVEVPERVSLLSLLRGDVMPSIAAQSKARRRLF